MIEQYSAIRLTADDTNYQLSIDFLIEDGRRPECRAESA